MIEIFQEIKKNHITKAAKKIDIDGVPPKNRSTKYDVLINKKRYPPKYIISLAYELATGQELSCRDFKNNEKFRENFIALDFNIIPKQKNKPLSN